MDEQQSASPPLPPDPPSTLRKVQPFQEQFVVRPAATPPPQEDGPMGGVKRSNTSRSRATSKPAPAPAPLMTQPQPIKDAVNNAFDHSQAAQNQLDPELIRQVTEQVIKNLQTTAIAGATPTASVQPQQSAFVPPPPPSVKPVARSPTVSSTDSIPPRYTPPTPEKRGKADDVVYGSSSPEPMQSDQDSVYSKASQASNASTRSRDTPKPAQMDGSGGLKRSGTTPNRWRDNGSDEDTRRRSATGPASTARNQSRPYRRDSKDSDSDYYELPSSRSRARPVRIPSEVEEATTLEKIWQPLFDNGNPTIRLSQFLRGLALHLVDDYEPKGSLVVTPAKMLRFFNEAKAPDECYPWDVIFGGKLSNSSISKIYQKLLCQQHLVQVQNHEVPNVPGLTPSGFEQLMTCLIQAHPDTEFERLACAVMNMPISNADNKSERFPKELSRRLLPSQGNLQAQQRIEASFNHEPILVQLRGISSMPPPPPASAPPQQTSFTERERKPYAQSSFSNVIDDEDLLGQPSVPIERERKPYFSKEGQGKMYNGDNERERDSRPPTSYRPDAPPKRRNSRSSSNVPTQATYSSTPSDPVNIPSQKSHRASVNQGPPPAMFNAGMNGSMPKAGRRTPPPRNMFARSEPVDVNNIPSSEYTSNLHSGYPPGARDRDRDRSDRYTGDSDAEDTARRYHARRPTERERSGANNNSNNNEAADDLPPNPRGYPIPPRQPPSAQGGYDAYNTGGGPPVGSYPRPTGFAADGRRATWYGATSMGPSAGGANSPFSGAAGSDGYGSYAGNNGGSGGGGGPGYPPPQQQAFGSSGVQQH